MNSPIPILKIEFEHMKYSLRTALLQHHNDMGRIINESINNFFAEDNINNILKAQINYEVKKIFEEELDYAFKAAIRKVFSEDSSIKDAISSIVKNNVTKKLNGGIKHAKHSKD
jgi:hypothetical protein